MVAIERELSVSAAAAPAGTGGDAIPLALRRRGGSPRQVFALTLIGALVLAVFASGDLSSWLYRMGDGPGLVPLQSAAAEWNGAMARLGLTQPAAALRDTIRHLLDWQWSGQD
jgi:hypothetical protein